MGVSTCVSGGLVRIRSHCSHGEVRSFLSTLRVLCLQDAIRIFPALEILIFSRTIAQLPKPAKARDAKPSSQMGSVEAQFLRQHDMAEASCLSPFTCLCSILVLLLEMLASSMVSRFSNHCTLPYSASSAMCRYYWLTKHATLESLATAHRSAISCMPFKIRVPVLANALSNLFLSEITAYPTPSRHRP
jgi:hypothetical protein